MFFSLNKAVSLSAVILALHSKAVSAFDNSRSDNLAIYWGQNSYGATHGSDTANWQKRLSFYCGSDSVINAIPVAFLTTFFAEGGLPSIDLSNICSTANNVSFPGTQLPECQSLATDIQTCQAAGKIVTISLGGASGAVGFTSDSQAQTFADTVWNLFLGGSSSTRPFGNAVLDGVDLDIEGGSSTGYAAFVNQIRSHAAGASKPYYITGAPQCPFPDASLGSVINAVGFDAVYVQFYNNFCGTQNFNNPNAWDFSTWDNWAKTTSPNKNVKVYLGVPASSTAAGSGYVDPGTLATIIQQTKSTYSSFGGVMMWDASQAYANSRYDISAKNALTGSASAPPPSSSPSTTTPTTTKSSTSSSASSAPTSGSCAGVAAWSSSIAYQGGSEVTYGGHLWTAKWWSQADVPGGVAGDWTDDGPCTSAQIVPLTAAAPVPVISESPDAKPSPSPAHQANSVGVDSLSAATAASTKLPTVSSPAVQSPKPATAASTKLPAASTPAIQSPEPATAASTKLPAISSPAIQSPKPATAASTKLPTVSSPVPAVHSDLVTTHNNLSSQPIAATSGVPKASSTPAAGVSHAPAVTSVSAAVSKPNDSAAIAQSAAVSGSGSTVVSGSGSVAAVPEVTQRNHARNFKY